MSVPSFSFLLFGLLAAALFNCSGSLTFRKLVLLAANLIFFGSFAISAASVLPFIGFLAFGYCALLLVQAHKTRLVWGLVAGVILLFSWLKRYAIFPSETLLPGPYVTVGLSYVFFRVTHLIIDAHNRELPGRVGLLSYINYTMNFTALVAGPIQRYQDYQRQEDSGSPTLDIIDVGLAVERIAKGFFKVSIVSMFLSYAQSEAVDALSGNSQFGTRALLVAVIIGLYPIFLYANFSGYTDCVIGMARLFRLELPENFNRPFSSLNFIDLWSRWHMSLSGWLKTYVYNPIMLNGMRRFPSRDSERVLTILAFFVTFFLVGVWHGQTSEFIVFGVLQGGGVALNKLFQFMMTDRLGRTRYRQLGTQPIYRALCRGLTFSWFAFTLVWFWSRWDQMQFLTGQAGTGAVLVGLLILILVATLALQVLETVMAVGSRGLIASLLESRYVRTSAVTAVAVLIAGATYILAAPAPDIVYKTF